MERLLALDQRARGIENTRLGYSGSILQGNDGAGQQCMHR